jgi:plastocyanin
MIHRRFAALACAVAFAGVLSACGADPNDLSEGLNGTETTVAEEEEVVEAPAQVVVTTTTLPSAPDIAIANLAFAPVRIAVKAGTTVTFTNTDARDHQVMLSTGETSDVLAKGDTFSVKLTEPGEVTYSDTFFNAMSGSIVVG